MYYRRGKISSFPPQDETKTADNILPPPTDCFAETARPWLWFLAFLVALVIFAGGRRLFIQFSHQSAMRYRWASSSPWTVGFNPCPYCAGILDALGRCNIAGCPIYSPDFGTRGNSGGASAVALIPTQSLPVKELGVDVVPCRGTRGVIIETVYPGSEAQMAGLRAGDLITNFNGRRVKNPQQLQNIAALTVPGTDVAVEFVRPNGVAYRSLIRIG